MYVRHRKVLVLNRCRIEIEVFDTGGECRVMVCANGDYDNLYEAITKSPVEGRWLAIEQAESLVSAALSLDEVYRSWDIETFRGDPPHIS